MPTCGAQSPKSTTIQRLRTKRGSKGEQPRGSFYMCHFLCEIFIRAFQYGSSLGRKEWLFDYKAPAPLFSPRFCHNFYQQILMTSLQTGSYTISSTSLACCDSAARLEAIHHDLRLSGRLLTKKHPLTERAPVVIISIVDNYASLQYGTLRKVRDGPERIFLRLASEELANFPRP